jgi:G:T-mismatch repair DNA endonuclease (very short patch repair protein)
LFNRIYSLIDESDRNLVFFHRLNKEFQIRDEGLQKTYIYDFKFKNKIIEFHGDYFHANPKIYDANYYNTKKGIFAEQIWEKDSQKIEYAEKVGYVILVVWQKDYKENPEKILKKCINFLKK